MPVDNELHEAVEAAWDKHSQGDAAPEPSAQPLESSDDAAPPDEAPVKPADKGDDGRDEKGRFAKARTSVPPVPAAAKPPAPTTSTPGTTPAPAAAQVPAHKPPQSWKATVREKWAALPPEVQAEVARREKETTAAITARAEAAKFQDTFKQTIAPYAHIIAADGVDPIRATASLFQTYAQLRHGTPAAKAQLVAGIIKTHGVDIDSLAAALDGAAPSSPQQAQQPLKDPRLDVFLAKLEQAQQASAQATQQAARQETEQFAQAHEFFDDVRQDMADLLEVASRRNLPLTLEDAYNRAIKLSPELSALVEQRQAAKSNASAQASTQRAKAAASSVKGQTAVGAPSKQAGESLRGAIEAAWEQHSGR